MLASARSTLVILAASGFLAFAGCSESGPPKFVIKGKISKKGEVIPVKETESKAGGRLRVWLKPADGEKISDVWEAKVNYADGTFILAGGDGRGVPQGKYKVCVEWKDDFPMGKDLLNKQFSETNTKIIREIPPPNDGELIIDVSKPEG
ncbi:MAG: hypothetical protein HYR84_09180 [Planctomycetes bacterium]|nr:hypothetical protein [Planctomycetota bacterium]